MNGHQLLFLLTGSITIMSILSLTGYSYAQSLPSPDKPAPDNFLYIFVQSILRNSEGQLITYLEYDRMTDVDFKALDTYLDYEASVGNDQVITINGQKYQVIIRELVTKIDSVYLMGSTILKDSQTNTMAIFYHDGFLFVPGDELTTFLTFFRSVD